jgi:hypothetical protein
MLVARILRLFVHRSVMSTVAGDRVRRRHPCIGGGSMLRACDLGSTIWLLRLALDSKPEGVDLEVVFELVAQLVTDVRGWDPWNV